MAFTGTISHESTGSLPRNITEEVIHCAEQVRAQKDALGASRLMKAFELTDGYQAYVLDMENIWRVHVIPPSPGYVEEREDHFEIDKELYPSLTIAGMVSGAAQIITLDYHEQSESRPWAGLYVKNDRVALMPETAKLFSIVEVSYKVGVRENFIFSPIRQPSETIYSQFATITPGNYTGAMSSVVQLLMGVGKLLDRDYEDRWVEADPDNRFYTSLLNPEDLGLEEGEQPLSFYNNKNDPEVMISYDWRWNRTHGIMWGNTNQGQSAAMLVELGQRGVYVMPFPVDELSVLPEVQAQYLRVYPDLDKYYPFRGESETLFEAFNGFPTGKRMHAYTPELQREVRAGYVIAADKDLADFYAGFAMCTNFGWAFHESRPTAINTNVRYNELNQKVGACYEIRLLINERPEDQKVRNTVTAQVIAALGLTDEIDRFKAARLPQDFAESMVESPDYEAFDAFEVTPDWTVIAEIAKVREGLLEYPGYQCTKVTTPCKVIQAPHFKYYEPAIGAVLFFDFEKIKGVPTPKRCDGPIFATYVNGSAEILNYFYEESNNASINENTRQVCQYTGGWEINNYVEGSGLVGHFYTSSRDPRQYKPTGGGTKRSVVGRRHGNYDFITFCAFFASHGGLEKMYVASETFEGRQWNDYRYTVAVSCASDNRSMFFMCEETAEFDVREFSGFSGFQNVGTSGAFRRGSIYNFYFHWTGVCRHPEHPPFGDPSCNWVNGPAIVRDPYNCHGTTPPSPLSYSVCCVNDGKIGGCYAGSDLVVHSPANNSVMYGGVPVTRVPTGPPGYYEIDPPIREHTYEVWAFGHPLMHNRRIRRRHERITDPSLWTSYLSDESWWRCAIPQECPVYPWPVVANYYGPAYVATHEEFGFGWVEYGRKPRVGNRFFGVVD